MSIKETIVKILLAKIEDEVFDKNNFIDIPKLIESESEENTIFAETYCNIINSLSMIEKVNLAIESYDLAYNSKEKNKLINSVINGNDYLDIIYQYVVFQVINSIDDDKNYKICFDDIPKKITYRIKSNPDLH